MIPHDIKENSTSHKDSTSKNHTLKSSLRATSSHSQSVLPDSPVNRSKLINNDTKPVGVSFGSDTPKEINSHNKHHIGYSNKALASQKHPEEKIIRNLTSFSSISLELYSQFSAGLIDSFSWPFAIVAIYGSDTIRTAIIKCFLLNGVFLLGSLFLFQNYISPGLEKVLHISLINKNENISLDFLKSIQYFFTSLYHLFWIYPICVLSFVLNNLWYLEISNRAYKLAVGEPSKLKKDYPNILKTIAGELYRVVLLLIYTTQCNLVCHIPYIGTFLSFIFFSWLSSFFIFEYKWINHGWSLDQRVEYFESHWMYFLGFGMPITLASFFWPITVNQGIYALLFPMFIIMSNRATPLPKSKEVVTFSYIPNNMPIFGLASKINKIWISSLKKK